jgi:hypothetical protein
MTIAEFIEKCQKRPLPSNPMARVKLLARELAEGAANKLWPPTITKDSSISTIGKVQDYKEEINHIRTKYTPQNFSEKYFELMSKEILDMTYVVPLFQYFRARWNSDSEMPDLGLLENLGYIAFGAGYFKIMGKSLDLLDEADNATILISYKRSESSAFALLVHDRLKVHGYEPFVDMQIEAGKKWKDVLKTTIEQVDYFVLLLGKETLKSDVTLEEIEWANNAGKTILIIRHNGFKFEGDIWENVPSTIRSVIKDTQHASEVLAESPSEYNAALDRLINYFQFANTKTE